MRHYHRTSVGPDDVIAAADAFFPAIGLAPAAPAQGPRGRAFAGALGTMKLSVKMEGGHYTFVEVHTDQVGESRLDKNVKKFFLQLHRQVDTRHQLEGHF